MAISAVALGLQKRMQPDSKLIIEVLFKIHPLDNVNYFLQTIIHNVANKNQLLHKSECAKGTHLQFENILHTKVFSRPYAITCQTIYQK